MKRDWKHPLSMAGRGLGAGQNMSFVKARSMLTMDLGIHGSNTMMNDTSYSNVAQGLKQRKLSPYIKRTIPVKCYLLFLGEIQF